MFSLTIFAPRRLALLLALMLAAPGLAAGQSRQVPVQAALTQVSLISDSPTETHLRLTFDPRANGYAAIGNDPRQPTMGFALTVRGPHAVTPAGLKGLVRQIAFEQAESILILRFATAQRATVSALPIDDRNLDLTISTGAKTIKSVDATIDAITGPLPAAAEAASGQDSYELVQLKYADVSEIVGLLTDGASIKSNDLFIPKEPAFGSNNVTGSSYNPGPSTQAPGSDDQPLGQSIDAGMAIDRRLNAIWLKGSPDRIARMKAMIAAIDIPLDSVIIETQFLELTESGARNLGIDFTNGNGQIGVATFQTGQFIPPGVVQYSGRYDQSGNRIPLGHVGSVSFQAAIYAQVAHGEGRIVSKPRISAQSGSTAKIITGDALPILTAITLSGVNGVSQQVQYVNVGVTLQIAPRVSSDGYVSSHVFAVVSSVTGFAQGYPTISQREAETSATVKDGDSFVIGGLTQEDVINNRTKIPLLGDIPLLGTVFGTTRKTRAKTELYIVITPHIVRRLDRAGVTPVVTTTTTIPFGAPPTIVPPPR